MNIKTTTGKVILFDLVDNKFRISEIYTQCQDQRIMHWFFAHYNPYTGCLLNTLLTYTCVIIITHLNQSIVSLSYDNS